MRFDDILSDEILITSYEYNGKSPRFFSKYFHEQDPVYDVKIKTAVGGSSSAPLYFNPKEYVDPYNITNELIDGGIICNNPSFYAYMMATELKGITNEVRIVSLGTGIEKEEEASNDPSSFNKAGSVTLIFDFMMSIESMAADEILRNTLGPNFVRMQTYTTADLATFGEKWYKIMRNDGKNMWEKPLDYPQDGN